ncbi:MAG TPA: helicase-exonuclease AddAB subunit AddA [Syntrophomonadaceae bacterium]|nr:helicase-exonuclease AddAB subunit AddA [Syntrophomonadaceae bacterium]
MTVWTDEQNTAITARNSNLLVSAAAGSGKTAVLVERIIRLLINSSIDIDRLLIVTFTHAAAGEMREKIGKAILTEMEKQDEHEGYLRRQANLLGRASISTIHAFCTDIVRRNFHHIDIDPNFRVSDQIEADLLKNQVMEELFEVEYEKGSQPFLQLVEMFGSSRDDTALADLTLKIYEFIQSQPYPLEWLKARVDDFQMTAADFYSSIWYQALRDEINMDLDGAKAIFSEALKWTMVPGGPDYATALNSDIALVESLQGAMQQGLAEFLNLLPGVQHVSLGKVSADTSSVLKERAQTLRNDGKKVLKDLKQRLNRSMDDYLADIQAICPSMQYLYQLEKEFTVRYQAAKLEKNLVDFNDLEHYTLKILADPEIAQNYRNQFEYIFVDEYQDSNMVQETILNFIRRDNNLFMVGDVKQSIYRFRMADPGLFMDKYRRFQSSDQALNRRINLTSNFRSRKGILEAVNYIFSAIMSRDFGEMDYDEDARLNPGLELPDCNDNDVEVMLIDSTRDIDEEDNQDSTGTEETIEELSTVEAEAHLAAGRIKALLEENIYDRDQEKWRKVEFRDIAVLLRATRNWSGVFQEVFTVEGIPAFADVNGGYFEAPEVELMLNLLALIDNRHQDVPLLSIMRSPIGGFNLSELIAVRINHTRVSFYEAVRAYLAEHDDELACRLQSFFTKLDEWREEARFMHLDEFIWKLLLDTGYYYYAGAMPGGLQRQANLSMLVDRASQYLQTSMQGLFNFIKFIERLKNGSSDVGTARLLGENENVVRIMSIHKSKGLEFPVVILAGLGKKFNLSDSNAAVLLHKDMGIGPRYIDVDKRTSADTIARIAMKQRIRMENLAEEMRILYVATTRAREKLIMMGTVKNLEGKAEKWTYSISPFSLARGQNYLDWIGPALIRHPDGEILRPNGFPFQPGSNLGQSKWKITIVNTAQIIKDLRQQENAANLVCENLADFDSYAVSEQNNIIESRLNWTYRFDEATRLPSKLSVTRIKDSKSEDLDAVQRVESGIVRRTVLKQSISAREKGTIMHFVMQKLDFSKTASGHDILDQIADLEAKELLLPEAAAAVDIDKIMEFCQSDLGRRIKASSNIYREVPFNLRYDADQIFDNMENCREKLLIQGVIDLFFEEQDELVLVDFKTDRITPENYTRLLEEYSVQVNLYREALQKLRQQNVKEGYLYFFDTNQAILV